MIKKKRLTSKKPTDNNISCIYVIDDYNSKYNYSALDTYRTTDIGVSKDIVSDRHNSGTYINPSENNEYDVISTYKGYRYGYDSVKDGIEKYGLDELLLMSIAINNNINSRISSMDEEYFINSLYDWTKKFDQVEYDANDIDKDPNKKIKNISHIYCSDAPVELYCTVRGIEMQYTMKYVRAVNTYYYILPPDIFKYLEIYDAIDSVRVKHIYCKTGTEINPEYPTVKYYDYSNDTTPNKDITEFLTTEINNMNLIK